MRLSIWLAVATICVSVAESGPASSAQVGEGRAAKSPTTQTRVEESQRGTDASPLVVRTLPQDSSADEIRLAKIENAKQAARESLIAWATVALALVTAVLAYFTYKLWAANKTLVDRSDATAVQQARDMRASLGEASRAADAMQSIAAATVANADRMEGVVAKQMRAYLAVDLGRPACQDEHLRFAGAPVLVNNGLTPAKNVSYRVSAAIMDTVLPAGFRFDDTAAVVENDAALGPRQTFVINCVVGERYEVGEVEEIMRGRHKRLYVWGTVQYTDVFDVARETHFCHNFTFYREHDGIKFLGYYSTTHNSIT